MTTTDTTQLTPQDEQMRDLAPMIHRQRLVVEGTCPRPIDAATIEDYLSQLSVVTDMTTLITPVTHRSDMYGWAGWIHWETSGAHFYAWDDPRFFSVDIYTCKAFSADDAVRFTEKWFAASEIVHKEF
jgi:S-adenosylmethionine/arginine decarboxylase-like enzyme